jgi:hypothetical protein
MQAIPCPFQSRASPHRGQMEGIVELLLSTLNVLRVGMMKIVMRKEK